jgi:hypothetical protein
MNKRTFAIWSLGIGLGVGLLASILFYQQYLGSNVLIFMLTAFLALVALSRPTQVRLRWRNLWLLLPMVFFALMIMVRADPLITLLNVCAILGLGMLILYYFPSEAHIDEASFAENTFAVVSTPIALLPEAVIQVSSGWQWLRENRHTGGRNTAAVIRGLVIAAPIVLVFVFLLGSADAVFANVVGRALDDVWQRFGLNLDATVSRFFYVIVFGLAAVGALGFGLRRDTLIGTLKTTTAPDWAKPQDAADEDAPATTPSEKHKPKPGFKLGMIESTIVLGSIVGLFGLFVVIQFAYFFGGLNTLQLTGLTYAQYARRGFFELVAVTVLTLGLALFLDRSTVRQQRLESLIFRGLALALVGLVMVMLVSASQRMLLYEEAFGFTQLRVYSHVSILWIAALFGVFLLTLFRVRVQIFSFGSLLVIIGYLVSLNMLNVDAYIAERNIARWQAGEGRDLDVAFLNTLSVDALPAVYNLYSSSPLDSQERDWAGRWLAWHWGDVLTLPAAQNAFAFNLSRRTGYDLVAPIHTQLPEVDRWSLQYSYGWTDSDAIVQETSREEASVSGWDTIPATQTAP